MYIHSSLRMVQSALCCNAFRSCLSFGHGACRTFPSVTGSEAELAINSLNAELNPIRHLLALVGSAILSTLAGLGLDRSYPFIKRFHILAKSANQFRHTPTALIFLKFYLGGFHLTSVEKIYFF